MRISMTHVVIVLLLFLCSGFLSSQQVLAQKQGCGMNMMHNNRPPESDFPGPPGAPPDQRQKHIEQLRIFKLLEILDLDETQELDFLQTFRTFRKQQRLLSKERSDIIDTLAMGLRDSSLSPQEVYSLVDRVNEKETSLKQLEKKFLRQSKRILTAGQFGRLVVFQHRFEYELLSNVRSFWERRNNMRWRNKGAGGRYLPEGQESIPCENH